ncbi:LacI family DNA-binding transcriptional regulator [Kushneria indalinina]|uniref:LacI family transcriptional regulator n=1 Tax=Kushneria indalinina DSM 14324 TaxID=1122140 RepID=A0A3D9E082_9GAMM|nr:LacI family DNA-binding transcriptional regulator [Kushneria indalinina]REC96462.1 LacI family transcriptional regulator [Kushneria indalinina DSM 14324]
MGRFPDSRFDKAADGGRDNPRATGAVRLSDVAAAAGVAAMTVSRALNQPELVSERTRERVQRAVIETGYVPNRVAGALASSRSKMVAVLVPTVAHSLFADVVQSITDTLAVEGYQVLLGLTGYQTEEEAAVVETVLSRRPDALVVAGTRHSEATRQRLGAARIPVVEIWDMSDDPLDMLIGFSHHAVGEAVADHLLGCGYQRFGQAMADDPRSHQRAEGFNARILAEQKARPDAGIKVTTHWAEIPATLVGGRTTAANVLAGMPDCEAIFCSSDTLAMGVIAEAQSRAMAIPEALAVMGFGDMSFAAATWPALSTVRIDGAEIGRLTAAHLLQRFGAGSPDPAHDIVDVGFEIVARQTTLSPRS